MSAAELSFWAVNVMKFSPSNTRKPTPEEFNAIIRGGLIDVWRYVVTHVRTTQTVRKVKGNLLLRCKGDSRSQDGGYRVQYQSDKMYNEERMNLEEKRSSLSRELANQMTAIYHVERDLNRIRNEIYSSDNSYQSAMVNYRDLNRKRVLLNALSQRCGDDVARLQEFTSRVVNCVELVNGSHRSDEGQSIVQMKRRNDPSESSSSSIVSSLETVCAKEVRECCELIGQFLEGVLSGSMNRDKATIDKYRADLWRSVEAVLRSYIPSQVLASICTYARYTTSALHAHTAKINVRTDAENLRFKYTSTGQLSDMSAPAPSDLKTVRQHLEDYEAAAVERFLQTEKCGTDTYKYKQRLDHITEITNGLLKKQAGDSAGAHQLIRSLFEIEKEITVSRAVLKLFDSIAAELFQQIDAASLQKQILYMKYSKIQDFKKIVESKQNLISVLVKQNRNSKHKLEIQQQEIQQYVERTLEGQDIKSQQLAEQLSNTVSKEVDTFSRVNLMYFLFSTLDSCDVKMPTVDLSIYRTVNNPTLAGNQTVLNLLKMFQFPSYRGAECLLSDVVEQGRRQLPDDSIVSSLDIQAVSLSDPSTDIDKYQKRLKQDVLEVCNKVKTNDRVQLEKLLPLLDKHQSDATNSLTACLRVKDLASDWWDQPAQMCNGWITVDGLNMQQWKDKWTVAVTSIRQKTNTVRN